MQTSYVDLAAISAPHGLTIYGASAGNQSGMCVSAGDVNGDGFDDVIIGAAFGAVNADNTVGVSYVVFGKESGLGNVDLSALSPQQGFIIRGADPGDLSSRSISFAGDVNGDGFGDLIVGAFNADGAGNLKSNAGESYIIFGRASGSDIDLAILSSPDGFRIFGADNGDYSGYAISCAGDFNGDGFDDLIIGAPKGDSVNNGRVDAGESYIIFGRTSGFSDIDLSVLTPEQGFRIFGIDGYETFIDSETDAMGRAVSSAGDINGDGFDDLIIAAPFGEAAGNAKSGAGESYVLFGHSSGFGDIDLATLGAGQGFRIFGEAGSTAGRDVSSAGDVNGDGFDDLVISSHGKTYVIFGKSSNFTDVDLSMFSPGQGFRILEADGRDYLGYAVSAAGDVNGDGFDDLIVGAFGGDSFGFGKHGAGESYVIFGKTSGFSDINLGNLTSEGFRIFRIGTDDNSGKAVTSGDVNGDGFSDLIVGAPAGDGTGNARGNSGETYVIFGGALLPLTNVDIPDESIDLAVLTSEEGFRVYAGVSVSSAGDINGDGLSDIIVGDPYANSFKNSRVDAGTSYVIFGKGGGFSDIANPGVADGFRIYGGDAYDFSGWSVASAGDMNGDGFGDIIIGARRADAAGNAKSNAGESYVIFGKSSGFTDVDLRTLSAPGFRIFGADINDFSGWSVSTAGDVNGDGLGDVILGAYGADAVGNAKSTAGESYVIFVKAAAFSDIDLATLTVGQGFRIFGSNSNEQSGFSVSSAGDVNADGFDDLIIGANQGGFNLGGRTYVVFGKASGFSDLDLATLSAGEGFRIASAVSNAKSGTSVASAGDINADGFADLIIGAPGGGPGKAYVILGKASGFSDIDLDTAVFPHGFRILGVDAGDSTGLSVASAGDVNGDGFDDVIVGSPRGASAGNLKYGSGESYVIYGKVSGFSDISLAELTPLQGFPIFGEDDNDTTEDVPGAGHSVASAGDVNGDGFGDILVGAFLPATSSHSSRSYVIFGSKPETAVNRTGTNIAQTISGGDFDDVIVALGGNDTVNGYGGRDLLDGGTESDTLDGGDGDDSLNGGSGNDILEGGSGADGQIGGLGIDTASYTKSVAPVLARLDTGIGYWGDAAGDVFSGIENLSGGTGSDTLVGDSGANVLDGGGGDDFLEAGAGADAYIGGAGVDTASYAASAYARLDTMLGYSGDAAGDTFFGIENLVGSSGNDVFVGDSGNKSRGEFSMARAHAWASSSSFSCTQSQWAWRSRYSASRDFPFSR